MHKSGITEQAPPSLETGGSAAQKVPAAPVKSYEYGAGRIKTMAVTEFEYSTIRASHAYHHWIACAMGAIGLKDIAVADFLVLNEINHHAHDKRLSDICFILNIEDAHVVAYSLRKLLGQDLIKADKHGNEVTYSTTQAGQQHLLQYEKIREQFLLNSLKPSGLNKSVLEELAQFLCKMSGLYDQAARAASSL